MPTNLKDEQQVRAAVPSCEGFGGVSVTEYGRVFAELFGEGYKYLGSNFSEAAKHPTVQAREKSLEEENG